LQDELAGAKEAYASANTYMQQQLQASNAARAAAEQRAYNMRNAFVPQANPNALSISYGDQRSTARKKENNQLSDLTILSGVGTTSNPLAGLQLA
jgi:predicted flap endonuclease-1-like 5' DNA nuclease